MRMIGGQSIMGACAGMIKPPAGEGSFAPHAIELGDDAVVNGGNSIRFRRRPGKDFSRLPRAGMASLLFLPRPCGG
jgi:hypothetical protein